MKEKKESVDAFMNRLMDMMMERQVEAAVNNTPIDTRTEIEKTYDEQIDDDDDGYKKEVEKPKLKDDRPDIIVNKDRLRTEDEIFAHLEKYEPFYPRSALICWGALRIWRHCAVG